MIRRAVFTVAMFAALAVSALGALVDKSAQLPRRGFGFNPRGYHFE